MSEKEGLIARNTSQWPFFGGYRWENWPKEPPVITIQSHSDMIMIDTNERIHSLDKLRSFGWWVRWIQQKAHPFVTCGSNVLTTARNTYYWLIFVRNRRNEIVLVVLDSVAAMGVPPDICVVTGHRPRCYKHSARHHELKHGSPIPPKYPAISGRQSSCVIGRALRTAFVDLWSRRNQLKRTRECRLENCRKSANKDVATRLKWRSGVIWATSRNTVPTNESAGMDRHSPRRHREGATSSETPIKKISTPTFLVSRRNSVKWTKFSTNLLGSHIYRISGPILSNKFEMVSVS